MTSPADLVHVHDHDDPIAFCLSSKNRINPTFWKDLLLVSSSKSSSSSSLLSITTTTTTTTTENNTAAAAAAAADNDNDNKDDDETKATTKIAATTANNNTKQQIQKQIRRRKLIDDGFVLIDESIIDIDNSKSSSESTSLIELIRDGIKQLYIKYKLPAIFVLLYDETWELALKSKSILQSHCHPKTKFNFDILAWYIDNNSQGFTPHRDRQPPNPINKTFYSQQQQQQQQQDDNDINNNNNNNNNNNTGESKFVTQWIALSEATPQNSCLYVIPRQYDPGYLQGDIDSIDPLSRALPSKQCYQNIQALPRRPGQSILFTHRIIHWGSKNTYPQPQPSHTPPPANTTSSDDNEIVAQQQQSNPRIAISFVCSDPTYEPPLIKPKYFSFDDDNEQNSNKLPPFHIRMLLICAQLLIYYQRYIEDDNISKESIKLCYEYCKQHEHILDETYKQKVFLEFVNAMKELKLKKKEDDDGNNNNKADARSSTTAAAVAAVAKSSTSSFKKDGDGDDDVKLVINGKAGPDNHEDDDDDDDDEEEAMMEEMLNAEKGGYGEFEDDYDELEENQDDNDVGDFPLATTTGNDNMKDEDDEDDDEEEFDLNATFAAKKKSTTSNGTSNSSPPTKKLKTDLK